MIFDFLFDWLIDLCPGIAQHGGVEQRDAEPGERDEGSQRHHGAVTAAAGPPATHQL